MELVNEIILKAPQNSDALEVIKANGFKDEEPDINLLTGKLFSKPGDGIWRFDGWHHFNSRWQWEDVRMVRV